jgi:hypothetical protein
MVGATPGGQSHFMYKPQELVPSRIYIKKNRTVKYLDKHCLVRANSGPHGSQHPQGKL